jgi:hypothetical protein
MLLLWDNLTINQMTDKSSTLDPILSQVTLIYPISLRFILKLFPPIKILMQFNIRIYHFTDYNLH